MTCHTNESLLTATTVMDDTAGHSTDYATSVADIPILVEQTMVPLVVDDF